MPPADNAAAVATRGNAVPPDATTTAVANATAAHAPPIEAAITTPSCLTQSAQSFTFHSGLANSDKTRSSLPLPLPSRSD
ncbi:MAG: hypothetical protein K2X93_10810 [Candidatus Obscuribacterales bacterium]|nr:hypothetical protein [Candidatus Obscuribacterales bacterium]